MYIYMYVYIYIYTHARTHKLRFVDLVYHGLALYVFLPVSDLCVHASIVIVLMC